MKYIITGIIILISISCDTTDSINDEQIDLSPIDITYELKTFTVDYRISAYLNDSLLIQTESQNNFNPTESVSVGDVLKTEIEFIDRSSGGTEIWFTYKDRNVGTKCNIAANYPGGTSSECQFELTEELYNAITSN